MKNFFGRLIMKQAVNSYKYRRYDNPVTGYSIKVETLGMGMGQPFFNR